MPKQSFDALPADPGKRKYWGREEDWRLLLRTHLPSFFPEVYTSSQWWRQLDLEPWWAGLRPRTQT